MLQTHHGARPRAARPHARPPRRAAAALGEPGRAVRGAAAGPRRSLGRGARARDPRQIRRADHRAAHRLLRGAGAPASGPTARGSTPPSPPGRPTPSDTTAAEVHRGRRAAPAGAVPPPQSRARRHRARWCACASNCSTRSITATTSRRSMPISSTCSRRGSTAASWCCAGSTGRRRRCILEKIIRYEAVHASASWDDLRRRIDPPDRRCYAFFHPALIDEPLIFVEVALTREHPGRDRADPVGAARRRVEPEQARRRRCSIRSRTASAGLPACRSATS